jgi:hypothetical protein
MSQNHSPRRVIPSLALLILLPLITAISGDADQPQPLGDHIVLSWNDLGMHCMNKDHAKMSILPPYNNLFAQVIERGDAGSLPRILDSEISLEYSIPGNTYSVGKTDFWEWDIELFGVDLPPNIGLTGKGLEGEMDAHPGHWVAEGIPITPFTDTEPNVEDPYQQALIIARDGGGMELARSEPVIPVSTEVNCVSSGCHTSEDDIIFGHDDEGGYNPYAQPILCAGCHASPALGTPGIPEAKYMSFQIHDKHKFMDETNPGQIGCEKCHPGPNTHCLRGTMNTDFGMVCQDCHGDMDTVSRSIENGRTPWLDEPACRDCHTSTYGEPVGQLYRNSQGHGGVYCAGCHGSPHAIYPSREARDNANNIALQGHSGTLNDCSVCHGVTPGGSGPHGIVATDIVEVEIMGGRDRMLVYPSPLMPGASATFLARNEEGLRGRMLVFDARGRTIRLLDSQADGSGHARAAWDGTDRGGQRVAAGVYFVRWEAGQNSAAGKVVLVD